MIKVSSAKSLSFELKFCEFKLIQEDFHSLRHEMNQTKKKI